MQGVATGARVEPSERAAAFDGHGEAAAAEAEAGVEAGAVAGAPHFMLVTSLDVGAIELSLGPHVVAPLRMRKAPEDLLPLLRRYVPSSVAAKLHEGVRGDGDLSEMRQACNPMHERLQPCVRAHRRCGRSW